MVDLRAVNMSSNVAPKMRRSEPRDTKLQVREDFVNDYDEFGDLESRASRIGVPWRSPLVRRCSVETSNGKRISMLRWGEDPPQIVCFHGRGQNAHTWDAFALAIDVPLVAIDLPGHGHSDWNPYHDYSPQTNALSILPALETVVESSVALVGMSLGGLTSLRTGTLNPSLMSSLTIIDITPGSHARWVARPEGESEASILIDGRKVFVDIDDLVREVISTSSTRSPTSTAIAVRHNAKERVDGTWVWRYDQSRHESHQDLNLVVPLWDDLASIEVPLQLIESGNSRHVHPDDEERFRSTVPHATVEMVAGAGHSVQSTKPRELVALVTELMANGKSKSAFEFDGETPQC
jgi:pimeloyl-ACP methyl ester carboxylesterase